MIQEDIASKLYDAPASALVACAEFRRELRRADRQAAIQLGKQAGGILDSWVNLVNVARAAGDEAVERNALGTVAAFSDLLDDVDHKIAGLDSAHNPETHVGKESKE